MPGGSWRSGESLVRGTDGRRKRGGILGARVSTTYTGGFFRQWRVSAQRSRGGVRAGGVSKAYGRAEVTHRPGPSRAQWAPGAEGRRGPIQGMYMVWGSTWASVAGGQGSDAFTRGFDHKRGVDLDTGIDCRLVRANRVNGGDDRARTVKGREDEGRSGKG